MNFLSAGKVAFRSLRANKMRSILTMLGMIIGVAAVIIMVAIGEGANQRISAQIASVGSNLLLVLPGSTTSGGLRSGFGGAPTLTMADARAIGKELSSVRGGLPHHAFQRTRRLREPELEHDPPGSRTGVPGDARVEGRLGEELHRPGDGRGGEGLPARADGGRLPVRHRGPGGEDRADQAVPLHGGRRPRPEGAIAAGPGSGRRGGPPHNDDAEEAVRERARGGGRRHHGAGGRRRQRQGGRAAGDRNCCASATGSDRGEPTISRCGTFRRCWPWPSPPHGS